MDIKLENLENYYDDSFNRGLNFNLIVPSKNLVINDFMLIYFPGKLLSPKINFSRSFLMDILCTTKIKQLLFLKSIPLEEDSFMNTLVDLKHISNIKFFIDVFNIVTNNKPIYYCVAPSKQLVSKETFLKIISDKC